MAFDKLLVLDLDETLVHATETPLDRPPDYRVGPYVVYKRPGVEAFVAACLDAFAEVAIWTASTHDYALEVLAPIVDCARLSFVWARRRCTLHVEPHTRDLVRLKDLRKLKRRGYDPAKVIFVDDSPGKLRRSYGNLVTVRAFEGQPDDRELSLLLPYLLSLGPVDNVRTIEKRGWRSRMP